MAEVVGTFFIISLAGIVFGHNEGKKVAVRMLIGSIALAFVISPSLAAALILAHLAMCLMILVAVIALARKL